MLKKNYFVKTKSIAYASALAVTLGMVLGFCQGNTALAADTDSNTQVTVTYYTGIPTTDISYEDAYLGGDAVSLNGFVWSITSPSGVGRVAHTTKSRGRIQWGEPDSSGNYAVYYDAADIHMLAAKVNNSETSYKALYDKYLKCKKAIYE